MDRQMIRNTNRAYEASRRLYLTMCVFNHGSVEAYEVAAYFERIYGAGSVIRIKMGMDRRLSHSSFSYAHLTLAEPWMAADFLKAKETVKFQICGNKLAAKKAMM